MAITTTLAACSQTVALNGPDGAVDAPSTLDDSIRYALSFIAQIRDTYALTSTLHGKNIFTNSDVSVSQINGSTLTTPVNGSWPVDMFYYGCSQASKLQAQQAASSKLSSLGATNSITFSTLSSFSPAAGDYFFSAIGVEGFDFARFEYGTANAKAGSLQFKANASVSGTYSGALINAATNRSYPFSFALTANTDTLVQVSNIPGDTTGTWLGATNAMAMQLRFDLGSGTTYKGAANAWSANNYVGATGALGLASQVNGSTLTISDIQFELGATCTQYERRLYAETYLACQRYLPYFEVATYFPAAVTGAGAASVPIAFKVQTRVATTGAQLGAAAAAYALTDSTGANKFLTGLTWTSSSMSGGFLSATGASGLTAGDASTLHGTSGGYIVFTGAQL